MTMPFGLSTAPLVLTKMFQEVVAHLHRQSIFIHSYLDDSLLKKYAPISSERSYPFCDRFAPQTGFPYFMEKVVASTHSVADKSDKVAYLMSVMYPPNTHLKLSVCYFQCFYFYFNRVVTNSYRPIF